MNKEHEEMLNKIREYQHGFIIGCEEPNEPERAPEWQVLEDLIKELIKYYDIK